MSKNSTAVSESKNITTVTPAWMCGIPMERMRQDAKPRHVFVGEELIGDDPCVYIHTAGRDVVWKASLARVIHNRRFLAGLCPYEAMRLGFSAGSNQMQRLLNPEEVSHA